MSANNGAILDTTRPLTMSKRLTRNVLDNREKLVFCRTHLDRTKGMTIVFTCTAHCVHAGTTPVRGLGQVKLCQPTPTPRCNADPRPHCCVVYKLKSGLQKYSSQYCGVDTHRLVSLWTYKFKMWHYYCPLQLWIYSILHVGISLSQEHKLLLTNYNST